MCQNEWQVSNKDNADRNGGRAESLRQCPRLEVKKVNRHGRHLLRGRKSDQCGRENNRSINKNWETRGGARRVRPGHVQHVLVAGHAQERRHPAGSWRAETDNSGRMTTKKYEVIETKGEKFQEAAIDSVWCCLKQTAKKNPGIEKKGLSAKASQKAPATGRMKKNF